MSNENVIQSTSILSKTTALVRYKVVSLYPYPRPSANMVDGLFGQCAAILLKKVTFGKSHRAFCQHFTRCTFTLTQTNVVRQTLHRHRPKHERGCCFGIIVSHGNNASRVSELARMPHRWLVSLCRLLRLLLHAHAKTNKRPR